MAPIALDTFRDRMILQYGQPQRALATRQKVEHVLRHLESLGATSTADLTTELAGRYVSARSQRVCLNTVRGELAYLRSLGHIAVEEGWLERSPRWRRIWPRRSRPRIQAAHSVGDITRVLGYLRNRSTEWIDHRSYALASLLAHTGVRRDEALYAFQSDFDLQGEVFSVVDRERLKTEASEAPVPLPFDAVVDLTAFFARTPSVWAFPRRTLDGPWTTGGTAQRPTGRLLAAGRAVGVQGLTCNSLRHSFATHARRRFGVSEDQLADILRHTTTETQKGYVHRAPIDELRGAVQRVRYR